MKDKDATCSHPLILCTKSRIVEWPGSDHPEQGVSSLPANGFASTAASLHPWFPLLPPGIPWPLIASSAANLPKATGGRVTKSLETEIDMPSPRFFSVDEGRRQHFLGACFLCKKPIAENEDIFMYSTQCRWEQMDMDEALQNEARTQSPLPMKRKPSLIVPSECDEHQFVADATAVVAG
ncbi:hypothetical protein GW17_00035115 [Ensete ventricosum]|nr:hypothetical protein GW17_00035115 [Ensete ventricosum]